MPNYFFQNFDTLVIFLKLLKKYQVGFQKLVQKLESKIWKKERKIAQHWLRSLRCLDINFYVGYIQRGPIPFFLKQLNLTLLGGSAKKERRGKDGAA